MSVRGIALDDAPSQALVGTWERLVGFCYLAAAMPATETRAFLVELDRTDAEMPIVDPTGYRAMMGNIQDYRAIAKAFLAFQDVCEKVARRNRGEWDHSEE